MNGNKPSALVDWSNAAALEILRWGPDCALHLRTMVAKLPLPHFRPFGTFLPLCRNPAGFPPDARSPFEGSRTAMTQMPDVSMQQGCGVRSHALRSGNSGSADDRHGGFPSCSLQPAGPSGHC